VCVCVRACVRACGVCVCNAILVRKNSPLIAVDIQQALLHFVMRFYITNAYENSLTILNYSNRTHLLLKCTDRAKVRTEDLDNCNVGTCIPTILSMVR